MKSLAQIEFEKQVEEDAQNIVEKFVDIRKTVIKKSQEQVADSMYKTQSSYARIERGATKIDLATLCAFARVAKMSVVDVIMHPEKLVVEEKGEKPEMILELTKTKNEVKISYRNEVIELINLV